MAGLDWERQEKVKNYARIMHLLAFLEIGIAALFILVLLLTPLSTSLRNLLDLPQHLRVALYFVTIMLCFAIVSAPPNFYRGFLIPRSFGLLSQRLRVWLLDGLKAGVLGLMIGLGIMVFVYWLLANFPDLWWLLAAVFLILLTAVMTNLALVIIAPLFYRMEPLADISLGERLVRLVEKEGEEGGGSIHYKSEQQSYYR